jgi:hypothetical protein
MAGVKGRSGRPKGSGRYPGVPNKATADARAAIAAFVDGNAHRLQDWLDAVATGVPALDTSGEQVYDDDTGRPIYLVSPNPEKAFTMFQSVIEYHVPKLARTEMTGANGGPLSVAALDLKGLSDVELEQMQRLMAKAATGAAA